MDEKQDKYSDTYAHSSVLASSTIYVAYLGGKSSCECALCIFVWSLGIRWIHTHTAFEKIRQKSVRTEDSKCMRRNWSRIRLHISSFFAPKTSWAAWSLACSCARIHNGTSIEEQWSTHTWSEKIEKENALGRAMWSRKWCARVLIRACSLLSLCVYCLPSFIAKNVKIQSEKWDKNRKTSGTKA